jgi:hypothetical protein
MPANTITQTLPPTPELGFRGIVSTTTKTDFKPPTLREKAFVMAIALTVVLVFFALVFG